VPLRRIARTAPVSARAECSDDLRRRQQRKRQRRILAEADALLARERTRAGEASSTVSAVQARSGPDPVAEVTVAIVHAPAALSADVLGNLDPLTRVFDALLEELEACGELLPEEFVERPAAGPLHASSRKPAQGH
jgi:hypothetical protein